MKYFWIPAAVLCVLLGLSLWNARELSARSEQWLATLEQASDAARREDTDAVFTRLEQVRRSWESCRDWLHIVTAHDELESVDTLLAQAQSFAREGEHCELCATLAALAAQLSVVEEMQQLDARNVF